MKAPVHSYDWSALEQEFESRARAAGIEKGTLDWYGFSFEVEVPKLEVMPDTSRAAQFVDRIITEAENLTCLRSQKRNHRG